MENETDHSVDGNKSWRICHFHTDEIRVITGFPSNVYYTNEIALIFNILLTILTIFLNSVTILAFMRSTQLKRKKSYFLIMLLSVNDLLEIAATPWFLLRLNSDIQDAKSTLLLKLYRSA